MPTGILAPRPAAPPFVPGTDPLATRVARQHWIAIPILIILQTIRRLRHPLEGIPTPKAPPARAIPARPQPHVAALLQLAGEAEAVDQRRLGHTPGVVAGCGLRDSGVAQRGAHGAQRIGTLPRPRARSRLGEEPLSGCAVDGALGS